ncbi:MAG: hypothetical protein U0525_01200 [Patescibacteria group bacterium]
MGWIEYDKKSLGSENGFDYHQLTSFKYRPDKELVEKYTKDGFRCLEFGLFCDKTIISMEPIPKNILQNFLKTLVESKLHMALWLMVKRWQVFIQLFQRFLLIMRYLKNSC